MNAITNVSSRLLLKRLTDDLLDSGDDSAKVRAAALDLYALCSSITGIRDASERIEDVTHTALPGGEAISPTDAARCLIDGMRTAKFLRGIRLAIVEAQRRFSQRPIEILYAGCGPFAPLAVPLTTQFSADEIRFTLLDIHRRSLDAARRITQYFGASAFVRDYIECDASSYTHPAHRRPHVAVVETMQRALSKEPQVSISLNLAPQLHPRGILVPESISIDAYLSALHREIAPRRVDARGDVPSGSDPASDDRVYLGRILEITAESCRGVLARLPGRGFAARIGIPGDADGGGTLILLTTITVYDSIVLRDYESGLTYPTILHDLGEVARGAQIEFSYTIGHKPGFKYRRMPSRIGRPRRMR